MKLTIYCIIFAPCFGCIASTWYASPSGSGIGTVNSPISLSNALSSAASPAQPGDTIYLRGGTYTNRPVDYQGPFMCDLSGTTIAPIVIRSYPGEWAKLDGYTTNATEIAGCVLAIGAPDGLGNFIGRDVWFWDLEITDSLANNGTNRLDGPATGRIGGILIDAPGVKIINCIVHDTGNGMFLSQVATNAEVCGCVCYNNGWDELGNRGHGHGIYGQNPPSGSVKVIRDNICCNQFEFGMQFVSSGGYVRNFDIFGNTIFNNGSLSFAGKDSNVRMDYGSGGQQGIKFHENYMFASPGGETSFRIGTPQAEYNGSLIVSNCYFVQGTPAIFNFTNVTFVSNVVASTGIGNQILQYDDNPVPGTVLFDYNTYCWPVPQFDTNFYVYYFETNYLFSNWKSSLGRDSHSTVQTNMPSGTTVFLRQNPYDDSRSIITVFNWNTNDNVSVDASSVLSVGTRYQIRNAQDYFGPSWSGTYSGGQISLPMTNLSIATPVGATNPPAVGPIYGAFVMVSQPGTTLNVINLNITGSITHP